MALGLSSRIGTIGKATLVAYVCGTAAYARLTAGLNVLLTGVLAFAPLALQDSSSPCPGRVRPALVAGSGALGVVAGTRSSAPAVTCPA